VERISGKLGLMEPTIFPNPSVGRNLRIEKLNSYDTDISIQLLSSGGSIVWEKAAVVQNYQLYLKLPEQIPSGWYSLKLADKSGRTKVFQIIIP
jgi:hypothetical protein